MNKDEILARELGKLGAVGGSFGGLGGALGGYIGASFVSRFLPTETYNQSLTLSCDAERALRIIVDVLARLGQIQDSEAIKSPNPAVMGIIGSGFLNMNPCLIGIEIVSFSEGTTTISVSGAAKEGLIKQRTAEKGVMRVIAAIQTELSQPSKST